jgi:hypothetical protein
MTNGLVLIDMQSNIHLPRQIRVIKAAGVDQIAPAELLDKNLMSQPINLLHERWVTRGILT